jgi:hypothetical protein
MAAAKQQDGGFPQVNGIYRITNFCFLDNQMAMDGCDYVLTSATGGPLNDTLGTILLALYPLWNANLKACLSTSATLVGAKLSAVWPPPRALGGIVTEGAVGTGGAGTLPGQVSGIIKNVTIVAGRAYRGRYYMPFPYAAAVDTDNTPVAGYVTKLNNFAVQFVANISAMPVATTYNFNPVIYHRKAGKAGLPLANSFDFIANTIGEKLWATQRRRGDFGRLNSPLIH